MGTIADPVQNTGNELSGGSGGEEPKNQSSSRAGGKYASGFSSLWIPWNIDGCVCVLISFPQMYTVMSECFPSYVIVGQIELAYVPLPW